MTQSVTLGPSYLTELVPRLKTEHGLPLFRVDTGLLGPPNLNSGFFL